MKRCVLTARHQSTKEGRWGRIRETFAVGISHPDVLLAARDATNREGSDLILDNLKAPNHPTHETFGTVLDKLAELDATEGLIEAEEASDDGRRVEVRYWLAVDDEVEARIVSSIAYLCGCFAAREPIPTGGGVQLVE